MKTSDLMMFLLIVFSGINYALPSTYAHDIQAYPATSFVRIEDESFDKQYMQTGETLTVQGKIVSNVDKNLRGWVSIFSESSNTNNRWEILARDPPNIVLDVPGKFVIEYSISAKALEPGKYHIHTQFNVDTVGPQLGLGQTIVVEGEPLPNYLPFTNIAYQLAPIVIGSVVVVITVYYWRKRK